MSVAPFPWASLAAVSRAEVEAFRRLRRGARIVRVARVAGALAELVKAPVEILVRRARRAEPPAGADDFVAFVLGIAGEKAPGARVLVEVEAALASVLAARALERNAPRIVDGSRPVPPAIAGAVAAVVHAALRRAHREESLRVLSAGPAFALARDVLASSPAAVTAWLTVLVGEGAYAARVTVPEALGLVAREEAFELGALGELPLSLSVVAARTKLTPLELASLARGDVLVPGALAVGAAGDLTGKGTLVAARSERGLVCDLASPDRLVVRGDVETIAWTEEKPMSETTNPTVTSMALEDASVVVRVEVGSVEMSARAWSELGPGDVVTLGRRLGDAVVLRAGGVEVARGELVQVDGEVGVRILSRMGAEA